MKQNLLIWLGIFLASRGLSIPVGYFSDNFDWRAALVSLGFYIVGFELIKWASRIATRESLKRVQHSVENRMERAA